MWFGQMYVLFFYKAFANVEICLHLEVQVAVLSVLIF